MNEVVCMWCGVGKGEVDHHVSYKPEIINRICKKCHFLFHKMWIIPCQKCRGTSKVRYHARYHKSCLNCDPVRAEKQKIYDRVRAENLKLYGDVSNLEFGY